MALTMSSGGVWAEEIQPLCAQEDTIIPDEPEIYNTEKQVYEIFAGITDDMLYMGTSEKMVVDAVGTVTYTSQDPSIATVDEEGNVTAVSVGTTGIVVTMSGNDEYEPASITATVNVLPEPVALSVGTTTVSGNTVYSFTPATDGTYKISGNLGGERVIVEDWESSWGSVVYGDVDMGIQNDNTFQFYVRLQGDIKYRVQTTGLSETGVNSFDLTITAADFNVYEPDAVELKVGENTVDSTKLCLFKAPSAGTYEVKTNGVIYGLNRWDYTAETIGETRFFIGKNAERLFAFELPQGDNVVTITRVDVGEIALLTGFNRVVVGSMYTYTPEVTGIYRISTENGWASSVEITSDRASAYEGCFDEYLGESYSELGAFNALWKLQAGTTYYFNVKDDISDFYNLYIDFERELKPEETILPEETVVPDEPIVPDEPEHVDSSPEESKPVITKVNETGKAQKAPKTGDAGMPLALPGIAIAAGFGMLVCRKK